MNENNAPAYESQNVKIVFDSIFVSSKYLNQVTAMEKRRKKKRHVLHENTNR